MAIEKIGDGYLVSIDDNDLLSPDELFENELSVKAFEGWVSRNKPDSISNEDFNHFLMFAGALTIQTSKDDGKHKVIDLYNKFFG